MFFGQACTIEARGIFELIPAQGTALEDAAEVIQAVAEGGPIPVVQLCVQHLCQLGMLDDEVSEAVCTPHSSAPIL